MQHKLFMLGGDTIAMPLTLIIATTVSAIAIIIVVIIVLHLFLLRERIFLKVYINWST